MIAKIHVTIILFILITKTVIAHEDFPTIMCFGKVKVRVTTGYEFEGINKAWIIGKLSNHLLKRLNYNDSIFLDFEHHYIDKCVPDYFLSFDNGEIDFLHAETLKPMMVSKSIIIRQVSTDFDVLATLNLVEYSVNHVDFIKSNQNNLNYIRNYYQWRLNSIDTIETRKISSLAISQNIKDILKFRIDIPESYRHKITNKFSYYFLYPKYVVYNRFVDKKMIELDNVYQFLNINDSNVLIFDTDTSLYFIQNSIPDYLSKRHFISSKRLFKWEIYDVKMYNDTSALTNFEFNSYEPKFTRVNNNTYILKN